MHTPTPWYVAGTSDGYAIRFANPHEHFEIAMVREDIGAYRGTNDDDEGEANAAFIVKACNMHEKLVSLLAELGTDIDSDYIANHSVRAGQRRQRYLTQIRALLAKANE